MSRFFNPLTFGLFLLMSTVLVPCPAKGEEPPNVPDRLKQIDDKLGEARQSVLESLKSGKMNQRIMPQAMKEANEQLQKLADEIEALGPEKIGLAEHEQLTDIYGRLRNWDEVIVHAQAVLKEKPDSPATYAHLIAAYTEKQDLPAAEEALKAALAACAEKGALQPLHLRMAMAYRRTNKSTEAAGHLDAYLPSLRSLTSPTSKSVYLRNVDDLLKLFSDANLASKALARIDEELAYWKAQTDEAASLISSTLEARKIRFLSRTGDQAGATALLEERKRVAQANLAAKPDEAAPILEMADLLEAEASIAPTEKQADLQDAWLNYLADQFTKHPGMRDVGSALTAAFMNQTRTLTESEKLEEAQALQKKFSEVVAALPADSPERKSMSAAESMMRSSIRRLVTQRLQKELIGKPMVPLETATWVNGSPLSAEDLKGKVILIDFWAVWCGPCRATFPHLTAWHEKYEKDGLFVVGLTRYQRYGWNDETMTHERDEDITPEDEATALEKFAKHHQLKHRLAFIPDGSSLSDSYGVSGIPHVVVIDREGVIRMIRVGSGEKNAHDIETLLEELVHGKKSEAAAAN